MWIDFNLYFYVRIHTRLRKYYKQVHVVNWFQFVFLREDSHLDAYFQYHKNSCELISICIFTWGFTPFVLEKRIYVLLWIDFNLYFYVRIHTYLAKMITSTLLWIDFNLYFYVRIHTLCFFLKLICLVVNWFQFVFLREDSHPLNIIFISEFSCELISICIFTWGFTP